MLELIDVHDPDLVAEEGGSFTSTYASRAVDLLVEKQRRNIRWMNIDTTPDERKFLPDENPRSIGSLVDLELHMTREWIWVARTGKNTVASALVICGCAHLFSLAEKFRAVRCAVETGLYLAQADEDRILSVVSDCSDGWSSPEEN